MTKTILKKIIEEGTLRGKEFLVVKIETEGNPAPEIIINPSDNFKAKAAYYDKAYNEDLELLSAKASGKSIRITDAIMTSNFTDLNWFVY
jgi:hypothetical protein